MQVSFKKVREVLRKTEGSTQFFICRIYIYGMVYSISVPAFSETVLRKEKKTIPF
jgi:hypothetical protein